MQAISKNQCYTMQELLRSKKAISPILATLLIIVMSVAGIVVTFSWIQGYMGNQFSTVSSSMLIENVYWYEPNKIDITVRNTGTVALTILNLYIDGLGYDLEQSVKANEADIITVEYPWISNQRYKIKVVNTAGLQMEGTYKAPDPSEIINWLAGWSNRIQITIDSNNIDTMLVDFPLLIFLSNSSSGENHKDVSFIFDELQDNNKKIALTTSDGQTQCYTEIEQWNLRDEQAWLWTKVPTINNTTDTHLYLYYDADQLDNNVYVGDSNSALAQNVWDSDFKLVTHMRDAPDTYHIRDSTLNDNDGTKEWPNAPSQADGQIGKAQEFNRIISDHVNCGTSSSLEIQNTLTIEAWINPDSLSAIHQNSIVDRGSSYWFFVFTDGTLAFLRFKGSFGAFSTTAIIPTGTYTHVAVEYDTFGANEVKLYINGQLSSEGSLDGPIDTTSSSVLIGDRSNVHPFDGVIDEVRICLLYTSPSPRDRS